MSNPLRITIITRKHVIGALCLIASVIIVWQGVNELVNDPTWQTAGGSVETALENPVRRVPRIEAMALTVNVDWGNEQLPALLAVLRDKGVQATFFLTGRWAKRYPDMARLIAEEGHEIGNHGRTHAHPTQLSDGDLHDHIGGNVAIIAEATGVDPVPLYAPPYGEQDKRVVRIARASDQWTTLWTLDTIDWQNPSPGTIIQRIVPRATAGGIVLMHPKPQSVEALPTIIDEVRARGLEWMPLYAMIESALAAEAPSKN